MFLKNEFADVKDEFEDFKDRFDKIEDNIKKLFKKTNYESVGYFKFMNDAIRKMQKSVEEIEKADLHEIVKLKEKYSLSFMESLEIDLFPKFKPRISSFIETNLDRTLGDYVTKTFFEEE